MADFAQYTFQNAAVANGNGPAVNVLGVATISIQIVYAGAATGTVNFEVTGEPSTFANPSAIEAQNVATDVSAPSATANGVYQVTLNGSIPQLRCRISGYTGNGTTDTITVKAISITGAGGGGGGGQVSIAAIVGENLVNVAGAPIAQGHGAAATAIRVELPTDGTGNVKIGDAFSTLQLTIGAFHSGDNQLLPGIGGAALTAGVAQMINASGNADRQRGTGSDGITNIGIATGSGQQKIPVTAAGPVTSGAITASVQTTVAVASNNANVTAATLNVASAAAFPASGTLAVQTTGGVAIVAYTGKTATTFTGCTVTSGSGTVQTGNSVQQAQALTMTAVSGTLANGQAWKLIVGQSIVIDSTLSTQDTVTILGVSGSVVTCVPLVTHGVSATVTFSLYNELRDAGQGDQVPLIGLSPSMAYLYNVNAAAALQGELERSFAGELCYATGRGSAVAVEYEDTAGGPILVSGLSSGLRLMPGQALQGKGRTTATITATVAGDTGITFASAAATKLVLAGHPIRLTGSGTTEYVVTTATWVPGSAALVPLQSPVVNAGQVTAKYGIYAPDGPGLSGFNPEGLGIEEECVYDPVSGDYYIERSHTGDGINLQNVVSEGVILNNGAGVATGGDRWKGDNTGHARVSLYVKKTLAADTVLALGGTTAANSLPVTMATDQGALGSVVIQSVAGVALVADQANSILRSSLYVKKTIAGDTVLTLGQATMANSIPVAIGSDQVGTAGAAAANVFTIQGIAAMTKLLTTPDNPPNLDVALSTRLKPADTLTGVTTVTTVSAVTAITNALPTGANVIGQVTANAGTNLNTSNLDVLLSTRLKPADTLTGVTTVTTVSAARIVGNTGAVLDAAGQNVASPANELLTGAQFNTTPTTITTGNMSPLQCDSKGSLRHVIQDAAGNIRGANVTATNALVVDGSAVTQPVSAASLPLPAGAATSANQPGLGTQSNVASAATFGDVIPIGIANAAPPALTEGRFSQISLDLLNNLRTISAAPPLATIFSGTATGTAAAAVADIAGATAISANKIFQGTVAISATATQAASVQAAGTLVVTVTWVPGTAGTPAQRVATVNLNFGIDGATNLTATQLAQSIVIPIQLYVGTTSGKFQVASLVTGTVSTQAWDVFVNGNAN